MELDEVGGRVDVVVAGVVGLDGLVLGVAHDLKGTAAADVLSGTVIPRRVVSVEPITSGAVLMKQTMRRRKKLLRGLAATYVRGRVDPQDDGLWEERWSAGVSDRQSLNADRDVLSARYHYASMELLITRDLHKAGRDLEGATVVDLGSGGGHWVAFYRSLGAGRVIGSDLAKAPVEHLAERFAGDEAVEVLHGSAEEVLIGQEVDVVNAIGVLFHVVDDERWRRALVAAGEALRPGGLLIVGGHFGWLPSVNVQFAPDETVNKRLRPRWRWERELRAAGFSSIRLHRNPTYALIGASQPENHLLVAERA